MFVDKVHITIYKMFVGSDKIRNSLSTNTIYKHLSPALSTNITYKRQMLSTNALKCLILDKKKPCLYADSKRKGQPRRVRSP